MRDVGDHKSQNGREKEFVPHNSCRRVSRLSADKINIKSNDNNDVDSFIQADNNMMVWSR